MRTSTVDKGTLYQSFEARRTRLLARRKLEAAKLAQAREAIRRIDREILALDRERLRPASSRAGAAVPEDIARAARQFASTATR